MRELVRGLWQGDISDLNLLKMPNARSRFTLAVNVGSTNFIPPDLRAIHFPMKDDPGNDWCPIVLLVNLIVDEIRHGGTVLVTCDAGISRSIVIAAMVIARLERVPMDDALLQRVRAA